MSVTNRAIGESINLAQVLNTKLEAPILQSEMGLDAQATGAGDAVRWEEFSARHNNSGSLKFSNFNKTGTSNPSPTNNTYGTPATVTPPANYTSIYPTAIDVVFGGTFGSETVTAKVRVTYSDASTGFVVKTATATGTASFTNTDLMGLIKDGVYISQIFYESKSTIDNSAVTVTFNRCGLYL